MVLLIIRLILMEPFILEKLFIKKSFGILNSFPGNKTIHISPIFDGSFNLFYILGFFWAFNIFNNFDE